MYKLLIVDDEPLVQIGMKSILDWQSYHISICGTASNGKEALAYIDSFHPQIIISDIRMPVMDGLALLRTCRERYGSDMIFIMLSGYEDFQYAREAMHYGAFEYLLKVELSPQMLGGVIENVLRRLDSRPDAERALEENLRKEFHDKFFLRLLNNLFDSPEQYRMQCRELNLKFESDSYLCCCCRILAPSSVQTHPRQIMKLCRSTISMISELTERYLPTDCVALDTEHFSMILGLTQEQRSGYRTYLSEILRTVFTAVYNYFSVQIVCAVGSPCDSIALVSTSYTQAGQLFSTLHHQTETAVFFYEDSPMSAQVRRETIRISEFKESLRLLLVEYDTEALNRVIRTVEERLLAAPENEAQARDTASNILYIIMATLPDGEETVSHIYAHLPDGYRTLYQNLSVAQTVEWLEILRSGLGAFFSSRRKNHKQTTVSKVQLYIQSHLREKLTLNDVADVFSLSPSYLSTLFARNCDYSFTEYVNHSKIQEAKKLLHEGQLKIYEIAEALGYENAFYFSKVFKKVEGISPREYLSRF